MSENITRTIYGAYLQTCKLMDLPFTAMENTTLNEKFNIASGVAPSDDALPAMQYFAIGNGGHTMTIGAGGLTKPEVVQHGATDAALYNHLPFVLRAIDNDLTPTERLKYALRRQETHSSAQYIAYYLKRIDFDSVTAGMEATNVEDDVSTTTPFVADSSNLNPEPPDLSPGGINIVSGDYVSASAKITVALTADDIQELLDVATILYEDEGFAIISEVALCSGVDKVISSPAAGSTTINFKDAVVVQVVSHINLFIPVMFTNNGAEQIFDVGCTEPLFILE